MKHARRRLVGLLRKQSMGDLMGCQVSNIWKDNFAYDGERVDVSLELKPVRIAVLWACAMPGWALPSWQFQMFSAGIWPGQSCGQRQCPSLCCPCSVPPGCSPGAVVEEKQSCTGGHRPSVVSPAPVPSCNQVEPPSCHQWTWSQALQLSDLITDFNSCCLQLNYPVSCCTMPSELFGGWILTSGLYLLRCCLLCLFHALVSSRPWVGALGVLVDTVIMLYPALFFYIWFIFARLEVVFFYFLISYLCGKSQNVWFLHCRIKGPVTLLARNKE